MPNLPEDPRFLDWPSRKANENSLREIIEKRFSEWLSNKSISPGMKTKNYFLISSSLRTVFCETFSLTKTVLAI